MLIGIDLFLDGPDSKARDAVHVIFAGEKVRSKDAWPAPDVLVSDSSGFFRVIALAWLIQMKLISFRLKDQVHLLDLIEVGLIDESSMIGLPTELADRLEKLIKNQDL